MANPVTYADLNDLLVGKGFVRRGLSEQHVAYLDPSEEPIFVFPALPMDRAVRPVHLATVRRWLIEMGLSHEEDIERWLCQVRFGDCRETTAVAASESRAAAVG